MFSRTLSSAIAATAIVAAAPAFAADPFDGPGWEPAIVGDTVGDTIAAPVPKGSLACADVQRGGVAERDGAPRVRDAAQANGADLHDASDRSQDFGG